MIQQALGIAGVVMVLGAYFLLVSERLQETSPLYVGLNVLGSGMILASLAQRFNLPATVLQGAWIAITMAGALFRRRETPTPD